MTSQPWKADLAPYPKIIAAEFTSKEDLYKAIDVLRGELYGCPYDFPGGRNTIIVPPDALPYFAKAGLNFTTRDVVSAGDISRSEYAKLVREQGHR